MLVFTTIVLVHLAIPLVMVIRPIETICFPKPRDVGGIIFIEDLSD